jgi:hypothetical protein
MGESEPFDYGLQEISHPQSESPELTVFGSFESFFGGLTPVFS